MSGTGERHTTQGPTPGPEEVGYGPDGGALAAAVRAVLARLDRLAAAPGEAAPGDAAPATEPPAPPAPSARPEAHDSPDPPDLPDLPELEALASCFALSVFECQTLLLAAAAELDPTTPSRCAAATGAPDRTHPTFSLALAALDAPHWSALTPVAPLRRWRLVEPEDPGRLTTTRLRIDERVLHFLAGTPYLDARLHGTLRPVPTAERLPDPYVRAADRVAAAWSAPRTEAPLRVELVGGDQPSRAEIAAAAAARSGLGLYTMSATDVPTDPGERDRLTRLWQREAILLPAALLLEADAPDRHQAAAVDAFAAAAGVPLVLAGPEPRPSDQRRGDRVTVPVLGEEEQLHVWRDAFRDEPGITTGALRTVVAQFHLPPHTIRAAASDIRRSLADPPDGAGAGHPADVEPNASAEELLWRAGLVEARMGLDDLGRRIEPEAGWDDLVLAERQQRTLREIVAHVRQRATVHQEWGFSATLRRGLGVTALFAGGSGTGKTLAAEVMAHELGLDLFVIDLSQVVSKYIGETEKNLRRVFDAADRGGALLLFDEADALFGKRSEVKDSHDRYANLEVSYLLMRMEAYRGLAVLTTNMKKALDQAFMRRIRFVVDFPFPTESERAEIWRRVIPDRAPSLGLDPALLARLTVAGGSIRNIALSGAFLAAEEGDRLGMRHMLAAARTEYQKLERSVTPSEVRGWI